MTVKITTTTAKAWIALISLIVTAIAQSNLVPVSGTWHTIISILLVITGAFATWRVPNKVVAIKPSDTP